MSVYCKNSKFILTSCIKKKGVKCTQRQMECVLKLEDEREDVKKEQVLKCGSSF